MERRQPLAANCSTPVLCACSQIRQRKTLTRPSSAGLLTAPTLDFSLLGSSSSYLAAVEADCPAPAATQPSRPPTMVTRPRPASAHVHRKGISARRAPAKVAFGTAVEKPGPKQKDVAAPAAAPIVAPEPEKKLSKAETRRQEAQQEVQQEAEEHAKVLRQAEAQLEAGGSSKEPLQAKLSRSARRLSVASSAAKALGVQMEREVRYDRESVMSIFARSTGSSDQPRFGKRSEARLRADGSASAVAAAEEVLTLTR